MAAVPLLPPLVAVIVALPTVTPVTSPEALTAAVYAAEDAFALLPIHWIWWPAIGGLAIGVGGWIYPGALGVGYDAIGEGVIFSSGNMNDSSSVPFEAPKSPDAARTVPPLRTMSRYIGLKVADSDGSLAGPVSSMPKLCETIAPG